MTELVVPRYASQVFIFLGLRLCLGERGLFEGFFYVFYFLLFCLYISVCRIGIIDVQGFCTRALVGRGRGVGRIEGMRMYVWGR